MNWTVLISFILLSNSVTATHGYVRGCYFTNWAQYREGDDKFLPEDIPKGLCTHILYAFAHVDDAGNTLLIDQHDDDLYKRVIKLKQSDPELKVLLSYGGHGAILSQKFAGIARSPEKTKHFIESAIATLRKYNFDGFDFDWEFPQGAAQEHANLVAEMKKAFVNEAKTSGNQQLLLTAAVSAGKGTIDASYKIESLGKDFDLLFLMSYDFHGTWEHKVNMHGKLHASKGDTGGYEDFNTEFAANYWASKGMPKEKIIIGIPTYGPGWTLTDPSQTSIGAPAVGVSKPTKTNPAGGSAAYWEICDFLKAGGKETVDNEAVGVYMVKENQWYSYDNEETIEIKMKWLKEKGYGGAFIWTIDFDDFKGKHCGKGPYPLLNVINSELGGEPGPTTESAETTTAVPDTTESGSEQTTEVSEPTGDETTEPPETTETSSVEPTGEPSDLSCPEPNGLFPHPSDCHIFVQCDNGDPHEMRCPPGTFFNGESKVCDHMANAPSGCT